MKRMMKYFFLAGHVQYARYITQYLIKMRAHAEDNVDLACRHQDGYWNAIRICKGTLKGMTLFADLVSEWINAFPITFSVSDRLDSIYSDSEPGCSSQKLHKEEMKYRRALVGSRLAEVKKYPFLLEDNQPHLYNHATGQIPSTDVNVADSIIIGKKDGAGLRSKPQ